MSTTGVEKAMTMTQSLAVSGTIEKTCHCQGRVCVDAGMCKRSCWMMLCRIQEEEAFLRADGDVEDNHVQADREGHRDE